MIIKKWRDIKDFSRVLRQSIFFNDELCKNFHNYNNQLRQTSLHSSACVGPPTCSFPWLKTYFPESFHHARVYANWSVFNNIRLHAGSRCLYIDIPTSWSRQLLILTVSPRLENIPGSTQKVLRKGRLMSMVLNYWPTKCSRFPFQQVRFIYVNC